MLWHVLGKIRIEENFANGLVNEVENNGKLVFLDIICDYYFVFYFIYL